jgi:hypothetical protein
MKKAKIMLMAIAVVGVLGGALAFKAKSAYGGVTYYTATTSTIKGVTFLNAKTTNILGKTAYYTLVSTAFPTNFATITTVL